MTIASNARVADALRLFGEQGTATLAVVDEDRLVGTVSHFDVVRSLRLQELLASQHPGAGGPEGNPPA